MARVIEIEVINPYSDMIKVSADRLRELEEAGKKNKIQLVKVVKIVKKED